MTPAQRLKLEVWLVNTEHSLRAPPGEIAALMNGFIADQVNQAADRVKVAAGVARDGSRRDWPELSGEGVAELAEISIALDGKPFDSISMRLWSAWGALTIKEKNDAVRSLPDFIVAFRNVRPGASLPSALAYLTERRWEKLQLRGQA